jgi:hypothetical protein
LNYGAAFRENRPIDFLQRFGEYVAIHYKACIAPAFWSSPTEFGGEDPEPEMPEAIPNTNVRKAMLAGFTNDVKEWKSEAKKILEHKRAVFALVWAQLSKASRSEIKDHPQWEEMFHERDLLYLINRIRATHIARQSGNPGQDMERVRSTWATMYPQETSFVFRKRAEDYQLERTSVGLPVIPDDELVIGILNRLNMSRYSSLVWDYLDNERRGIAALPELPSTLWKEIKDTQVVRFRGTGAAHLQAVYLSRVDDLDEKGRGGRGGRGRTRGRGRGRGTFSSSTTPPACPPESIKPADIICWSCGKKGHRSTSCPTKTVHFSDSVVNAEVFLTTITNFHPASEDNQAEPPSPSENTVPVFHSTSKQLNINAIMLDTQSAIHPVSNKALLTRVVDTATPVVVQGTTQDKTNVTQEEYFSWPYILLIKNKFCILCLEYLEPAHYPLVHISTSEKKVDT